MFNPGDRAIVYRISVTFLGKYPGGSKEDKIEMIGDVKTISFFNSKYTEEYGEPVYETEDGWNFFEKDLRTRKPIVVLKP